MSLSLTNNVACICEGKAEEAIIDILLDERLLIFERSQMLEEEIIHCRGWDKFELQYMSKTNDDKISVIRILDSKSETFKISKGYRDKIDVINVVTRPEIEMLIIISEEKLPDYEKSRKKPSDYCKQNLKMGKNIKSYEFVKDYFSDSNKLVKAIRDYDAYAKKTKKTPKGMYTLSDLLRTK